MVIPMIFAMTTATLAHEQDVIDTREGGVEITFIGHGSLYFTHNGKTIFVDPYGKVGDYSKFPKADLILVTHDHFDHLDAAALAQIRTVDTKVVTTPLGAEKVHGGMVMKNGDTLTIGGIRIEAVPAYNIVHKRPDGAPFHPKGAGNGYVLTIGGTRFYIAGDTENIPEMSRLKNIDVAFLPMDLPYTMTPEMTAAAARAIMPKILYPYHYGETDTKKIVRILKNTPEIDVRIRRMK